LPPRQRRRLQAWFWSIAATTLLVVVIGGVTRLTQSGLSIVDWDPLIGVVPPLNDAQWAEAFARYQQFPDYRTRPGMTLSGFKIIFFWEYVHRLVARLIGVVFLVPFLMFWRAGYLTAPIARRALLLFGLGALQGVMGWLMVRSGLVDRPSVSHYRLALHLGLALVILGYAVWIARDLAVRSRGRAADSRSRAVAPGLRAIGAVLALQIVWGAFVAGTKAGLIFNTFPAMAGRLLPPEPLTSGPLLRALTEDPAMVQWMHRMLGTVLLVVAGAFFLRVRRSARDVRTRRFNLTLFGLIVCQYILGVLTLIYRLPLPLAVTHQAAAAVLVAVWAAWMHDTRT
jgi:cytochrome c oxidase assembly protein subunit 15